MIFVTGDTHQSEIIHRFNSDNFPVGKELTKDDYVIICGDVGILWNIERSKAENYIIEWLAEKPWTTLFVLGNHENYDHWDTMEKVDWHGGKVNKLADNIIHLCSGEVFDIDGNKFFCIDGAASHDIQDGVYEWNDPIVKEWVKDRTKFFRVNKVSWWEHELPTPADYENARKNLEKANYQIDYIISHSPSTSELVVLNDLFQTHKPNKLTYFLEEIKQRIPYKRHYFGHMHRDELLNGGKDVCVYEDILSLDNRCWF